MVMAVDPKGAAAKAGLLGTRRGLSGVVPGDVIVKVCRPNCVSSAARGLRPRRVLQKRRTAVIHSPSEPGTAFWGRCSSG